MPLPSRAASMGPSMRAGRRSSPIPTDTVAPPCSRVPQSSADERFRSDSIAIEHDWTSNHGSVSSKQTKRCTRVAGIENSCWTLETGRTCPVNHPFHCIRVVFKMNRVHMREALTLDVVIFNGNPKLLEASTHGPCVLSCMTNIEKFHRLRGLCRQEKGPDEVAFRWRKRPTNRVK